MTRIKFLSLSLLLAVAAPGAAFNVGDHFGYNAFQADNALIGVEQVGSNLYIMSFDYGTGGDQPLGQGSITLGLCADAACSNTPK